MLTSLRTCRNVLSKSLKGRFRAPITVRSMSETSSLFSPTDEHQSLRNMVRSFVEAEVEPQALEFNKHEKFNVEIFRKLGELGLLGITVDPQYGGSGMDAVAAVIVHGTNMAVLYLTNPLELVCLSQVIHSRHTQAVETKIIIITDPITIKLYEQY